MEIYEIVALCSTIVAFVGTVVGFIIALVKSVKKYTTAKTEAEKEAALNDMKQAAQGFIKEAEEKYEEYTKMLVAGGSVVNKNAKTGVFKKDSVMAKLLQYAQEKGYTFDSTYWSGIVDELVDLTKSVNTKAA